MSILKGVIPAMITPLKNGGKEVDFDALRNYCEFLVARKVQGLFVCGTTGEGPLLSIEERKSIAEAVVDQIRGKVKVIIHTGHITTADTIQLTKHAQHIGADAAGMVLPYFYYLDEKALVEHFVKVARAVPHFSLLIYNIPQCAGNNLTPELLKQLLKKVKNFTGIKNSNPNLLELQEHLRILKGKYSVFVGCDGLDLAGLTLGAQGIISGNASAFPEPFINLYQAFKKGDIKIARKQQILIDNLRLILKDGRYPAFYKKALALRGIKVGSVRPPQRELSSDEVTHLKKSLKQLDFI